MFSSFHHSVFYTVDPIHQFTYDVFFDFPQFYLFQWFFQLLKEYILTSYLAASLLISALLSDRVYTAEPRRIGITRNAGSNTV